MIPTQRITPCIWFDTQAEEAAKLYTSVFENSRIKNVSHYPKSVASHVGKKMGEVMVVDFELAGLGFQGLNGGPQFQPTPAMSFFVWCKTEKEIDRLWKDLSQGGSVLMELNSYPWAPKYGWCEDKFGVSWQLMMGENQQKIAIAFLFVRDRYKKGEEAIEFWISKFKHSKLETVHHDPESKTVMFAKFQLEGRDFVLMEEKSKEHKFDPTLGISLVVNCESQAEIDQYWQTLADDGGKHSMCGWLSDKFQVHWQVIPTILSELVAKSDAETQDKVMKTMLSMQKINIREIKDAAEL